MIVASRPSTIALADDVVYVAGGRVAAHGTHDELMQREPAYRQLVEAFESDRDRTDDQRRRGGADMASRASGPR